MSNTAKTPEPLALRLADILQAGENFYGESTLWFDSKLADAAGDAADELRRLAAVEAERDRYATESAQHFIRAREWAERAGALEAELDKLRVEVEALRGLKPEIPQRPAHNNDASYQHPALPRYGLRWNGPGQPVSVPMADGYWTPFHLALEALEA